jgi:hypothetical protein
MERSNNTGWIVAGVLAVVIVILLAMMWQQWNKEQHNLGMVLENGQERVAAARNQIAEDCQGSEGTEAASCKADLDQLSQVLEQFSKSITTATSSQASTTAP